MPQPIVESMEIVMYIADLGAQVLLNAADVLRYSAFHAAAAAWNLREAPYDHPVKGEEAGVDDQHGFLDIRFPVTQFETVKYESAHRLSHDSDFAYLHADAWANGVHTHQQVLQ